MKYIKNVNYILLINILLFIICLCIFFVYSECLPVMIHDCMHPYRTDTILSYPRVPPYALCRLYYVILPSIFGMHPSDFKINPFVCSAAGIFYMLTAIFFSRAFYTASQKYVSIKEYFMRKESIILFPLCFLLLSASVYRMDDFIFLFLNIKDFSVFSEYCAGYIFYFLFFSGLFFTILNNKKLNFTAAAGLGAAGFILACWSEFLNMPALISILVLMPFIIFCFFKRKTGLLLLLPIAAFFAGIFLFYIFSGNYSLANAGTLGGYDIKNALFEHIAHWKEFNADFIECVFVQNQILWYWFIISAVLLKITAKIKNAGRNYADIIIYLSLSLITGYILTGYGTVFLPLNLRTEPLYRLCVFPLIGYHIIIYASLFITGALWHISGNRIKKLIIGFFLFIIAVSAVKSFPVLKKDILLHYKSRINNYNIEKTILVYKVLNESAVIDLNKTPFNADMPRTADENNHLFVPDSRFISELVYFCNLYKRSLPGFVFEDEQYARKQLEKRLFIIENLDNENKVKDKYNIFKQIQYTPLIKINKLNLTLEKIKELEKKYPDNDILIKVKASFLYKEKDFDKALDLYEKYIKINPGDLDALYKTAQIYKNKKQYEKSIAVYNKLLEYNSLNFDLMYELAVLYYLTENRENYKKALNIFLDLASKQYAELSLLYNDILRNIAILYKELKEPAKSREYADRINYSLFADDIKNFDEFYSSSNKFKLKELNEIYPRNEFQ